MEDGVLWEAKDESGGVVVLERVDSGESFWQLTVTEGAFSGYPTVDVTRADLVRLYNTIAEQLSFKKE